MRRRGFTLVEMLVVLIIISTLAALAIPLMYGSREEAADTTTRATMKTVRDSIMNRYWPDMNNVMVGVNGYPQPSPANTEGRVQHPQLHFLFQDPANLGYNVVQRRGWNGPYLQHNGGRYGTNGTFGAQYGLVGDAAILDGWGKPIVLQLYAASGATAADQTRFARLISAGPNGVLNTPADVSMPALSVCGDDVVMFMQVPDLRAP